MSQLVKCPNCGGELVDYNGSRLCTFCDCSFTPDGKRNTIVATKKSANSPAEIGVDVYEKNISGVIEIRWHNSEVACSGSGFIVNSSGYAVTNTHVVTDNCAAVNTLEVMTGDGFTTTGHVVALGDKQGGFGNGIDLAIIKLDKLPSKVNSLSFADFEKVKIGQSVYVIGNSLGYGSCITSGIVSDKSRVVNGSSLLMTDCAVNSGNSGGPMFNSDGKIIGVIVSGITKAEGMNFAIKGDDVRNWVTKNGVEVH